MTILQLRWAITAVMMVVITVVSCTESMAVVAYLLPFSVGKRFNVADYYLFVMIGTMTFPALRCARALRRLTADRGTIFHDVPEALLVLAIIGVPVATSPELITPVFGEFTRLFTVVLLWFAPLTVLGFVAAGARVDFADFADDENKPGKFIITVIYHLGGGAGIAFARIVFKDSPTFKDSPSGMPKLLGVVLLIGVVVAFARLQTIPTFQATPPESSVPFRTFQPTK